MCSESHLLSERATRSFIHKSETDLDMNLFLLIKCGRILLDLKIDIK